MRKIVVAQKTPQPILAKLAQYGEVAAVTSQQKEDAWRACQEAECLQVGTWLEVTAALMDHAPKLKVISRTGVGVDNVDVEAATARGIMVLHTPGVNTASVAEHTLALMLAAAKRLPYLDGCVRGGRFGERRRNLPVELQGKTLGLIGLGNIGARVAAMAYGAFSMRVIAYDPFVKEAAPYIAMAQQLEPLLRESDVVSIHVPLLESTRNLIGSRELGLMRSTAILVNASRGGIVAEGALYQALQGGVIAAAALDVFQEEPPGAECPLYGLGNVILTPHCAALTQECAYRVAECAADGIIAYLSGNTPAYVYNKAALQNEKKGGMAEMEKL